MRYTGLTDECRGTLRHSECRPEVWLDAGKTTNPILTCNCPCHPVIPFPQIPLASVGLGTSESPDLYKGPIQ